MHANRIINTGGGRYIEKISGNYIEGNYYVSEKHKTLAAAASEIQSLLQQLGATYPTDTTAEQMMIATEALKYIESDPSLRQRVLNAIKEGGISAFEKAIDNPAGAFLVGAIKGWQDVQSDYSF